MRSRGFLWWFDIVSRAGLRKLAVGDLGRFARGGCGFAGRARARYNSCVLVAFGALA